MEQITSRSNPLVGQIRKLNTARSARREQGLFVCDGPKLLEEALRAGAVLTAVVHDGSRPCPVPDGVREVQVPADLLKSLSTTEMPQGVLFLCRHHLAHRRRFRGRRAHPAARLRRPLLPQDRPGHHGGLLPAAGVGD